MVSEEMVRKMMRSEFEATFEDSVKRALAISHNPIVPHTHFAQASAECVDIYRRGFFVATALATQSVTQGIATFAAQKNKLWVSGQSRPKSATLLKDHGFITDDCAQAFQNIFGRYRNNISHMDTEVVKLDFKLIASENLRDLAIIENELFATTIENGTVRPQNIQYWDLSDSASMPVFLRCV